MQTVTLKSIAEIRSGYSSRGGIENDPEGNAYAIQMRDLGNNYSYIMDFPHKIKISHKEEKHLLNTGDIILISKGANNRAVVFDKDYKAVASSTFFVISILPGLLRTVNPYYISWYLNSSVGQTFFKAKAKGTTIPSLLLQDLTQLTISLPSLNTQQKLAKLYDLHKKENQLEKELRVQKNILIEGVFANVSLGKIQSK